MPKELDVYNCTILSDDTVAIRHQNAGLTLRCRKNIVTLDRKELRRLLDFLAADEIPAMTVTTPSKARFSNGN
jgi:hypothetical protein